MNLSRRILPFILVPLATPAVASPQTPLDTSSARVVRATGTARIAVKPDQAEIIIGVLSEAETAKAAAAANAAETSKIIDQLKKAVDSDGEIRTISYSVHPRYRHGDDGREPKIVGYATSNMVRVKLHDFEKIGQIIDVATETGANQIHGIEFTLENEQAARAEALQKATKEAMAGAEALAAAAGAKLGLVRSIEEQGAAGPEPLRAMAMAEARAASTPVEPGTIEVRASVTLTVDLE